MAYARGDKMNSLRSDSILSRKPTLPPFLNAEISNDGNLISPNNLSQIFTITDLINGLSIFQYFKFGEMKMQLKPQRIEC
jgi:hypothetical protein